MDDRRLSEAAGMKDTVCPHCMSETMIEKVDAWGVVRQECLDCGYVREKKRRSS